MISVLKCSGEDHDFLTREQYTQSLYQLIDEWSGEEWTNAGNSCINSDEVCIVTDEFCINRWWLSMNVQAQSSPPSSTRRSCRYDAIERCFSRILLWSIFGLFPHCFVSAADTGQFIATGSGNRCGPILQMMISAFKLMIYVFNKMIYVFKWWWFIRKQTWTTMARRLSPAILDIWWWNHCARYYIIALLHYCIISLLRYCIISLSVFLLMKPLR